MSKKARRRPSWKSSRYFYVDLINEETGQLMQTIRIKDGIGYLRGIVEKRGRQEMEKRLRQALIDLAERYKEGGSL